MNWLRVMDTLEKYIKKRIGEGANREAIERQFALTISQLLDRFEGTESD